MKKILSIVAVAMLMVCGNASAQNAEPEFVGEVNLVMKDGTAKLLDKENVQIKTKAAASLYLTGIGSVKSRITIGTPQAETRVANGTPFTLVVRAVDNNSDPVAVITLFKFDIKGKERRAELSKVNTFKGQSDGNMKHVEFKAKKYGKSSYELTIPNIEQGEYGVMIHNPNDKDEKAAVVACFGVD